MPNTNAESEIALLELSKQLGITADEAVRIGKFALKDGLKSTRTHTRRETQDILLIKAASVNRRIKIVNPRGNRLIGELKFKEKSLPLLTSFKYTGGAPRKSRGKVTNPKLKVRVRVGRPAETITGGFVKPNRYGRTDPADRSSGGGKVAYRRATIDGRLVGRLPYDAARGPSVLGLMESRPGFADDQLDYLADKSTQEYATRANRLVDALGGR